MDLSNYVNAHSNEEAWLFGKGPSFAGFDFSTAGKLRCAINDVAGHVPSCRYAFSNDGVKGWADLLKPPLVLFQPYRALGEFDSTSPDGVACDVVVYQDDYDDRRMFAPRETLAQCLAIRRGTLGSAIQILHIMGVKIIHLVGIDGGGSHACGIQWRTRLRHQHFKDYNAIRSSAIDQAELLGITLKFHNHTDTMTNDGRIFVRMIRSCFVDQVPRCEGEIVSFSPILAGQLIAMGSAVAHESAPEKAKPEAAIETAVAPMQAKESAVIGTKKGKR